MSFPRWTLAAAALGLLLSACLGGSPQPRATPMAIFVPPAAATATARAGGAAPTATQPPTPTSTLSATRVSATPTPSPALAPTATRAPAPAASTGPAAQVLSYIQRLAEGIGPRPAGTPQEKQAADLIATDLQRFGYQVQQQPFDVLPSFGPGILSVQTPSERAVDAAPLRQTGLATSAGDLVDGGLGRPEDFPKEGIKGKIALMERGQIFFEVKVLNAVAAGAAGAIIYNNESGPFSGTLGTQAAIPVVGIARGERLVLKRLLADGRVSVKLTIAVSRSQNMVAILNPGRPQAVIMGGHYDTVPQTGGANDNSSGTAAILVIAQEAAQRGYPFELRVIAFGAEELGLLRRAQEVAQAKNVAIGLSRLQGGSSDHASFLAVEIPAVFFSAGDLSRIHTAADTIANLDPPRLGEAVTMGLGMLDSLAR